MKKKNIANYLIFFFFTLEFRIQFTNYFENRVAKKCLSNIPLISCFLKARIMFKFYIKQANQRKW